MYVDKELEFSDAQAVTADAASTNYIDTQVSGLDYTGMWAVCQVQTTFDSAADNATLIVKVQMDDNTSFTSPADLYTTATLAQTALTAGATLVKIRLPQTLERYLRFYYDNGTAEFTAGKVDAFLTPDVAFGF